MSPEPCCLLPSFRYCGKVPHAGKLVHCPRRAGWVNFPVACRVSDLRMRGQLAAGGGAWSGGIAEASWSRLFAMRFVMKTSL